MSTESASPRPLARLALRRIFVPVGKDGAYLAFEGCPPAAAATAFGVGQPSDRPIRVSWRAAPEERLLEGDARQGEPPGGGSDARIAALG